MSGKSDSLWLAFKVHTNTHAHTHFFSRLYKTIKSTDTTSSPSLTLGHSAYLSEEQITSLVAFTCTHAHTKVDSSDGRATTGTTFVLASVYPPEPNYLQQLLILLFVAQ